METVNKFDYAISNPPYQEEKQTANSSRRITSDIFPNFQICATFMANKTSMIYPATWQKDPTVKLGKFLKENGLKVSEYFNSTSLFPEIRAGYPLSIVSVEKRIRKRSINQRDKKTTK